MRTSKLLSRAVKFRYSIIKDEITFTNAFRDTLFKKLEGRGQGEFLRLEISSGQGCEGFDSSVADSDYVWQHEKGQVAFAVDEEEFKLLRGATVDYASDMMKQSFYVKENPNAELSCSCKTSFSPKEHVL